MQTIARTIIRMTLLSGLLSATLALTAMTLLA